MIKIKPLASGSSGNCYKIDDGRTSLLIEAGIPIKQIKQGLNYKLSDIEGVLISHEHGDHCKSVGDVSGCGIDVYMSEGTYDGLDFETVNRIAYRLKIINCHKRYTIGSWIVKGFEVNHDAAEPLGFLFWSKETGEKLVYLTDTYYSKYTFHKLNYIMVECNYSKEILGRNVTAGKIHPGMKNRIIRSHFGLKNVKDFLRANDLSEVREIWLLHLSDRNSDEELFKREIQEISGKPVYIAG